MMTKSEILMAKLAKAAELVERAKRCVEFVLQNDEAGDGESGGKFMTLADKLIDLTDDLGYEIVMPMQVEEDEREEEIASLEARLAELRRQQ